MLLPDNSLLCESCRSQEPPIRRTDLCVSCKELASIKQSHIESDEKITGMLRAKNAMNERYWKLFQRTLDFKRKIKDIGDELDQEMEINGCIRHTLDLAMAQRNTKQSRSSNSLGNSSSDHDPLSCLEPSAKALEKDLNERLQLEEKKKSTMEEPDLGGGPAPFTPPARLLGPAPS